MTASRLITTIAASLLTACASDLTSPDAISLRILEINQSAPANAPSLPSGEGPSAEFTLSP